MKGVTRRAVSVAIMTGLVFCSFLLIAPVPVRATTSIWWTMYPSAYNSTWQRALPFPQIGPNPCSDISARDGISKDLYYAGDSAQVAENGDFTNASWSDWDEFLGLDYVNGTQPPDNATITVVWVTAYFMTQSPDCYLLFSVDNKVTWYNSDPILAAYGPVSWNVSTLIAWTPQLLKSPQTWAKINAFPTPSTHIYLDYIGISSMWTVPYGGGYEPPGGETTGGMIGGTWASSIVIGTLGGIGFIGMIAYPALAIYSFKSKDEKMNAVVGFIIGESLFVTLLWFALSVFTGNM